MVAAPLVEIGHGVIDGLETNGIQVSFAMWVQNDETENWKLWILPAKPHDKHDFYRRVSILISDRPQIFHGLTASDTELLTEKHPAIPGLRKMVRMSGPGSIRMAGNTFNGYYVPNGVLLRSDFTAVE